MQVNWKFLAIFGGIGFFLSFLIGLISRVGFGTVLVRGLVSGAVFAGIGFGILFLVKKYLPDLTEQSKGGETEGEGVDIVIEDNEPADSENPLSQTGDLDVAEGEDSADSFVSDNFVEEIQERSGAQSGTESAPEKKEEISDENGCDDNMQMIDGDCVNIDSLPDISDFSGSFSQESGSEGASVQEISEPSYESSSDSSIDQNEDPELIAKAIKTMLKKDTQ